MNSPHLPDDSYDDLYWPIAQREEVNSEGGEGAVGYLVQPHLLSEEKKVRSAEQHKNYSIKSAQAHELVN